MSDGITIETRRPATCLVECERLIGDTRNLRRAGLREAVRARIRERCPIPSTSKPTENRRRQSAASREDAMHIAPNVLRSTFWKRRSVKLLKFPQAYISPMGSCTHTRQRPKCSSSNPWSSQSASCSPSPQLRRQPVSRLCHSATHGIHMPADKKHGDAMILAPGSNGR